MQSLSGVQLNFIQFGRQTQKVDVWQRGQEPVLPQVGGLGHFAGAQEQYGLASHPPASL